MCVVRLLVALWVLSSASAAAFRPRGSAPYSNTTTSITTSLAPSVHTPSVHTPASQTSPKTTGPPSPRSSSGTAIVSDYGRPRPTSQGGLGSSALTNGTRTKNGTDPSCTVNVPSANLEWWYAATFDLAVGTLTGSAPNFTSNGYLTMLPNTDTFDPSSAITDNENWVPVPTYDAEWDFSYTVYDLYTVVPTAASTSIVTQNAALPLPSGNVIAVADTLLYALDLEQFTPSVVVASTANSTYTIASATPFIYFTAYEVASVVNGTTTTETVTLPRASAYEYWVEGIESSTSATGPLPTNFLKDIPQSSCVPGTVQGTVTVLVVLNLYYLNMPHANPFIVHIESTALGFDDPSSDMVVVAQETSQGQPFTMNWDPAPTHGGNGKTTTRTKLEVDTPGGAVSTAYEPASTPARNHNAGSNRPEVTQPVDQTVGSIGTEPVVVGPSTHVLVGTKTLQPGGPAVTVGGNVVSLAPSGTAIIVAGTTSALPIVADPGSPAQTVGTIAGSPVLIGPSSIVAVGSQTLQPGGPAITVGGQPVSLAPSGTAIVVGTKTSALPTVIIPGSPEVTQPRPPPILTIGSTTLTANAATQFFIAPGQTLTPGGTATVNGTVVSLAPSASFIIVGGSTQILPTSLISSSTEPQIVVGGTTITALPRTPNDPAAQDLSHASGPSNPTFVVSGQTLIPGHAITVDGTTISLAPSASFIVINGVTSKVAIPTAQTTPPPLTVGSDVFTALPGPGTTYQIGSSILTPGGTITLASGTTISLAPGGTALVVNGHTTLLTLSNFVTITNPPLLTIGAQTYTAAPGTGTTFIIAGQTLTPGGAITVEGTTISLAPGATQLVYGSSGRSTSTALFPATTTRNYAGVSTTSAPASASAGSTGRNGEAAATSSVKGAGCGVRSSTVWRLLVSLVAGLITLLLR